MESETFLQHLRNKPERVRQRIVFAVVILVSPFIFYVWSATNTLGDKTGPSTAETVRDTISGTFSNSAYEQTFGSPNFGKSQTANSIQPTDDTTLETQSDESVTVPTDVPNDTTTLESASGM
jgi:hypothetical protein